MAAPAPILKFGHVIDGFTYRQVVKLTSRLIPTGNIWAEAAETERLISRLSHKQRYPLTPKRRMVAVLFIHS